MQPDPVLCPVRREAVETSNWVRPAGYRADFASCGGAGEGRDVGLNDQPISRRDDGALLVDLPRKELARPGRSGRAGAGAPPDAFPGKNCSWLWRGQSRASRVLGRAIAAPAFSVAGKEGMNVNFFKNPASPGQRAAPDTDTGTGRVFGGGCGMGQGHTEPTQAPCCPVDVCSRRLGGG